MNQPGVKIARSWCLAIAVALIGMAGRVAHAQESPKPSNSDPQAARTEAAPDPASLPPLPADNQQAGGAVQHQGG